MEEKETAREFGGSNGGERDRKRTRAWAGLRKPMDICVCVNEGYGYSEGTCWKCLSPAVNTRSPSFFFERPVH